MNKDNLLTAVLIGAACVGGYFVFFNKPASNDNSVISPTTKPITPVIKPAQKLTLLFFHKNNCPPCRKFEKDMVTDPKLIAALANYIVITSPPAKDSHNIKPTAFPTFAVIDTNGKVVKKQVGYDTPENFIKWLTGAEKY